VAEEIAEAADRLSRAGTGAIIAVEGEVGLGDYITSGTALSAKVAADLVTTIFTPYSPLHDGALVVRGDTIVGAGCILPLTQFPVDDKTLGTRHRAAGSALGRDRCDGHRDLGGDLRDLGGAPRQPGARGWRGAAQGTPGDRAFARAAAPGLAPVPP